MKNHSITAGALSVMTALMLTACASSAPSEVRVTQADSGRHIRMHRGQELVVEVPRSGSNYMWDVFEHGQGVFEAPTRQVLQLSEQGAAVERYVFMALRQGEDQIRIVELPSNHSTDIPRSELQLNVTVTN
ncbi:hypothetical protein CUZ56_01646 [Saezia sanguinis]|uniref:Proteinase inhibitor I42 chagasin domain-containing protein n=1 Tax=Saezia sanguinis TaxID=1965230 RepID=A0A433SDM1_9BURK|nr:hypothetical protein [Saezia sanguinis]RUS66851.1 hypothetical protein CUZ56_01646 [Saezia sanguinis]